MNNCKCWERSQKLDKTSSKATAVIYVCFGVSSDRTQPKHIEKDLFSVGTPQLHCAYPHPWHF